MDGMMCEEPYFQWDDKTNTCLGCVKDGVLSDNCKRCEDYAENVSKSEFYKPFYIRN